MAKLKVLYIFFLLFLISVSCSEGANQIISHGFESYSGTPDTYASDYVCCATDAQPGDNWGRHERSSEVVSSYDADDMGQTWTAHSGTYFLLQNSSRTHNVSNAVDNGSGLIRITTTAATQWETSDEIVIVEATGTTEANGVWTVTKISTTVFDLQGSSFSNTYTGNGHASYSINPAVSGITTGSEYTFCKMGIAFSGCTNESITQHNWATEITTGIMFYRGWWRFNSEYGSIGGNMKLIRTYALPLGAVGDTVYMHLQTNVGVSPAMLFYCGGEPGGWIGTAYTATNAYDGNWHKFSMLIDWNNGKIYGWYDIDNETLANAVKTYTAVDGSLGSTPGTGPYYTVIRSNFSASYPDEEIYVGLDDFEVWDGLPDVVEAGIIGGSIFSGGTIQ